MNFILFFSAIITEKQPGKHHTCENTACVMSPYSDVTQYQGLDCDIDAVILF